MVVVDGKRAGRYQKIPFLGLFINTVDPTLYFCLRGALLQAVCQRVAAFNLSLPPDGENKLYRLYPHFWS